MKKFFSLILTAVFILTAVNICSAKSAIEQRTEINNLHDQALQRLYAKYPSARRVINNCYAYATLSNTGMKLGLFGSAHGRGVAINNYTGEKVYLKMQEQELGIGFGAKEYDLIFLIDTKAAWDSFIIGKIRFGAGADASANDGVNGGSVEGAEYVADGVWLYQMTKKGLSLEATLKGTKIYADKELN
ncbi:MAG: hypothetical protein IK062_02080 [Selenomonadaceae bacterium]|nr:hypothetical protein [Selenomonadaceae bacterium]